MKTKHVYHLLSVALLAAAMAVISPFSIHIGPIPLSFGSMGVYFCAALLGGRRGTAAVGIYLLLGALGLPVFTGFVGGVQAFVGPTGGYLVGYLLLAAIAGSGITRYGDRRPLMWLPFLLLGTAVLYFFGTVWFLFSTKTTLAAALVSCVLPFLPGDTIKILVTIAAGYPLKQVLKKIENK